MFTVGAHLVLRDAGLGGLLLGELALAALVGLDEGLDPRVDLLRARLSADDHRLHQPAAVLLAQGLVEVLRVALVVAGDGLDDVLALAGVDLAVESPHVEEHELLQRQRAAAVGVGGVELGLGDADLLGLLLGELAIGVLPRRLLERDEPRVHLPRAGHRALGGRRLHQRGAVLFAQRPVELLGAVLVVRGDLVGTS